MAPQYKLMYFNGRGRGEAIRLTLALAKVPFEDVRIEKEDWPKHKPNTPWGQMPVLEVDGVQIAQTKAITRFIAKRHGLAGATDFEQAKCDEYLDVLDDVNLELAKSFKETDPAKKAELLKTFETEVIPRYFSKFEAIIKKNGGVLVGKKVTFVDIHLAYMLEALASYAPGADFNKFPAILKLKDTVNSQPGIKEWIEKRPKTAF